MGLWPLKIITLSVRELSLDVRILTTSDGRSDVHFKFGRHHFYVFKTNLESRPELRPMYVRGVDATFTFSLGCQNAKTAPDIFQRPYPSIRRIRGTLIFFNVMYTLP